MSKTVAKFSILLCFCLMIVPAMAEANCDDCDLTSDGICTLMSPNSEARLTGLVVLALQRIAIVTLTMMIVTLMT